MLILQIETDIDVPIHHRQPYPLIKQRASCLQRHVVWPQGQNLSLSSSRNTKPLKGNRAWPMFRRPGNSLRCSPAREDSDKPWTQRSGKVPLTLCAQHHSGVIFQPQPLRKAARETVLQYLTIVLRAIALYRGDRDQALYTSISQKDQIRAGS